LLGWSIGDRGCEDLIETRPFYYSHAWFGGRMDHAWIVYFWPLDGLGFIRLGYPRRFSLLVIVPAQPLFSPIVLLLCAVPPPQCCPLPTLGRLLPSLPCHRRPKEGERAARPATQQKRKRREEGQPRENSCCSRWGVNPSPVLPSSYSFSLILIRILVQISRSYKCSHSVSVSLHSSRSIAFCWFCVPTLAHESYRSFQYLSREYLFTNFGGVFWELWLLEVRCQILSSSIQLTRSVWAAD
jgi:hypothetical protein